MPSTIQSMRIMASSLAIRNLLRVNLVRHYNSTVRAIGLKSHTMKFSRLTLVGVTVMAWINTERHEGPNNQRWQGVIAKSNNPRSYSLYTEIPSKCLAFSVGGGTSVCNKVIELNEWQHIVAQVDDRTHRYWINGEKAGEFAGKNLPPGKADTANVFVGKTHEAQREFLGLIDEIRVWNRALDEAEVP